ncbi:Arginine metabolism regulation protein II [Lachnellula suecica]|uniref:Arginine metabolism regulation protein II n=1 Tax=Lachnellula suecica TaxID=602035 RepID=A0A8T9CHS7_9HELO|nr:Arginine metabolism regulation protein II [Lachnellula suecica]
MFPKASKKAVPILPNTLKHPKRRSLPKVKTGCISCKTRRVKCDEGKPHCRRCIQFGVACGGYPYLFLTNSKKRLNPVSIIPQNKLYLAPTKCIFLNEEEYRYFEVFSTKTAAEILPLFVTDNFRQVLLQACEISPSIRHVVVALGAFDKTSQTVANMRVFDETSQSVAYQLRDNDVSELFQHREIAFKQYALGLKLIREAAANTKPDLHITLLTCLMIVCFEGVCIPCPLSLGDVSRLLRYLSQYSRWNGNRDLAASQIKLGFKFIQEWKNESGYTARSVSSACSDDLLQVFSRLDVQAISLAEDRSQAISPFVDNHVEHLLEDMPPTLKTLEDAEKYQGIILHITLNLFSTGVPHPHTLNSFPINGWLTQTNPDIFSSYSKQKTNIERWLLAYGPLYEEVCANGSVRSRLFAKTILLHLRCSFLGLLMIVTQSEMEFDRYNSWFDEVVELTQFLLSQIYPAPYKPSGPRFSFDSYVVIPLYLTGHKCRDHATRKKATELLLKYPRREGVWDSIIAGEMTQWAMEVEEEFMENEIVPCWARIQGMTYESAQLQEKTSILTCKQRMSPLSDKMVTRTKSITW